MILTGSPTELKRIKCLTIEEYFAVNSLATSPNDMNNYEPDVFDLPPIECPMSTIELCLSKRFNLVSNSSN